jgi:hypothetical protein
MFATRILSEAVAAGVAAGRPLMDHSRLIHQAAVSSKSSCERIYISAAIDGVDTNGGFVFALQENGGSMAL